MLPTIRGTTKIMVLLEEAGLSLNMLVKVSSEIVAAAYPIGTGRWFLHNQPIES
jgi:hypothetical protein